MTMPKQKPGRSKQDDAPIAMFLDAAPRFWARVDRTGSCWLFQGTTVSGYGWFYVGGGRQGVNVYAHRLALFYTTGVWGRVAMHSCDQRRCCNPEHLSWATYAENSQDALKKGRAYVGEANSNATLCDETVRNMRLLRREGALLKDIAQRLGSSVSLVSKVCRGEVWAHVS